MNQETQRLLFAAGRGAQVQTMYGSGGVWRNTGVLYTLSPELHRIHPLDVHLQYGPVSTELRRFACGESCEIGACVLGVADPDIDTQFIGLLQSTHRREQCMTYLLFLAELAADEGM